MITHITSIEYSSLDAHGFIEAMFIIFPIFPEGMSRAIFPSHTQARIVITAIPTNMMNLSLLTALAVGLFKEEF
tara:strand:- start:781 stop:1002 length:222 start_codon:yes stop_codon:yes gene_type:complete